MVNGSNRASDIQTLVSAMFDDPFRYRTAVEKIVSRNSKLSSKTRRELTKFAYGSFRWRDRLWDLEPSEVDFDATQARIDSFQNETLEEVSKEVKKLSTIEEQSKYLSYPYWLFQKWVDQYGIDQAIEICWIQNQPSELCIRSNGPIENFERTKKLLEEEGVEIRTGEVPGSMYILKKVNVRGLHTFKQGLFEIQDEHSQQVCQWSAPRPNQLIIDGCARAGGKALNLAALQNNQGRIICMDIDSRVFEEIIRRTKRLGIKTIETQWIAKDDSEPRNDLKEKADLVFVDAPCSGTGTIRHNPAVKWSLAIHEIENYQTSQIEILRRQSRWVKPKGHLVFVTCSNLREENENVIDAFLEANKNFTLIEQKKLLPKHLGGDGFFFAKLQKTGEK